MKLRTVKYIVKEGIINTYKNKLMSLASISIAAASLIILGIFLLIIMNISYNVDFLQNQPELFIYLDPALSDEGVKGIEEKVKDYDQIKEYRVVPKEEGLEEMKSYFPEDENVLDGYEDDLDFVPVVIKVRLVDPQLSEDASIYFTEIIGVDSVEYPYGTVELISRVSGWINLISSIIMLVLLGTSVSIIANTIKLTVFARRKEINIMKYIGATDWFIRWPFIIEGIVIGLVGAIFAYILVSYGYNAIENKLNSDINQIAVNFIKLIKFNQIGFKIIVVYSIIGSVLGAAGSLLSMRKHLRV